VTQNRSPPRFPARFTEIQTATLSNGIRVVVAPRPTIPAVQMMIQFNAGYSADASTGRSGIAGFASDMLAQGTPSREALEIAAEAERLGATIDSEASLDTTSVWLWALSDNLAPSVRLWSDVVMNASFPDDAIERFRGRRLARIEDEGADPASIASRILPPLIYGEGHAYAVSFTGTDTVENTRAITREDLLDFQRTWLRPDNATIFVVGDTTIEQVLPLLQSAFAAWRAPPTPLPEKNIGTEVTDAAPRVIIVDRPGSSQSLVLAGLIGPPGNVSNDLAVSVMNHIFGGNFSARLNMNLREDKHWAYSASSILQDARGPRPFFIVVPVQTDRTADAMREILFEVEAINGGRPITEEEMTPVINSYVLQLPGMVSSQYSIMHSLASAALHERPLDYATTLGERYQALTLTDLQAAARAVLNPDQLVWVIVGDRAQIENQITALSIAPIEHFNADGTPAD
jgi:zinc protease